jgi:hypothetical protein
MAGAQVPPPSALPDNIVLRKRRHRVFGATLPIWHKPEQTAAKMALVRAHSTDWAERDSAVLEECENRIALARVQVERLMRRSFSFWQLIHQVDEKILLVMPREMLYSEALQSSCRPRTEEAELPEMLVNRGIHIAVGMRRFARLAVPSADAPLSRIRSEENPNSAGWRCTNSGAQCSHDVRQKDCG